MSLSEKRKETNVIGEYFIPRDIKEFIKDLNNFIEKYTNERGMINGFDIKNYLKKRAGKELSGGEDE